MALPRGLVERSQQVPDSTKQIQHLAPTLHQMSDTSPEFLETLLQPAEVVYSICSNGGDSLKNCSWPYWNVL